MKTVFDHNITQEEKEAIGVVEFQKEEYVKYSDQDTAYCHLAYLYHNRNNIKKSFDYAHKIKDEIYREDCFRTITHP